jgi:hypothetical protein
MACEMSKIIGHGTPDNNFESRCIFVRLLPRFRLDDLQDLLSSLTKQADMHSGDDRFESQPDNSLSEPKCFWVSLESPNKFRDSSLHEIYHMFFS